MTCRCSTRRDPHRALWTREHAGLFDVSHMGQAFFVGPDHATTARALEALVPGRHPQPQARQAALFAAARREGRHPRRPDGHPPGDPAEDGASSSSSTRACKDGDYAHIGAPAGGREAAPRRKTARSSRCRDRPRRRSPALAPEAAGMAFMDAAPLTSPGIELPHLAAPAIPARTATRSRCRRRMRRALATPCCRPGSSRSGSARATSLRLEAGLCLYGHDIDTTTSPVEAGLTLVDPEAPARGRRLPRRGADSARDRGGAARVRVGLGPRAARRPAKAP